MIRPLIPALMPALVLAACTEVAPVETAAPKAAETPVSRAFLATVARVEPVAERECRARAPQLNCDYRIVLDDRPGLPPNALQTIESGGRPVILFTVAMLEKTRNTDEVAFILSHEAGHHIAGHLATTRQTATAGAVVFGIAAAVLGAGDVGVDVAQNVGANVGARVYSKERELEADELGTIIAFRAGYDPARGSEIFTRMPDPGDRFLGTHPPNGERRTVVLRTLAQLR